MANFSDTYMNSGKNQCLCVCVCVCVYVCVCHRKKKYSNLPYNINIPTVRQAKPLMYAQHNQKRIAVDQTDTLAKTDHTSQYQNSMVNARI